MTMRASWFSILAFSALSGCNANAPEVEPPKPMEVLVTLTVIDWITDYEDFTGRTEPVASVEVRARATGYLEKVNFKDGAMVAKDEVLFEIDPRPYEAELKKAD